MTNTIDIAIQIMKGLGAKETGMFQRDGHFYIASEKGFAFISSGLYTKRNRERGKENELIGFFKDYAKKAIVDKEEKYPYKPVFGPGEKQYFDPIIFKNDDSIFSIQEMAELAEKLNNNKDDGGIRIVSHYYNYHSHKYGYACDGTDVNLTEAWVAEREQYLQEMRNNENRFLDNLRGKYPMGDAKLDYWSVLQCIILTSNICAYFPLKGDLFRKSPSDSPALDSWKRDTSLNIRNINVPDSGRSFSTIFRGGIALPSAHTESPFDAYIKINAFENEIKSKEGYKKFEEFQKAVQEEISLIGTVQPSIEEIILKLNNQFNAMHFSEIEDWKRIERIIAENRKKEENKQTEMSL